MNIEFKSNLSYLHLYYSTINYCLDMSYFSHLIHFINSLSMCRIMSIVFLIFIRIISSQPHNYSNNCNGNHPQSWSYYWIDFDIFFHYIVWWIHLIFQMHISLKLSIFLSKMFASDQMCFYLKTTQQIRACACLNEWMNECKKRSRDLFVNHTYMCFIRGLHLISHELFIDEWTNEWMNELLYFMNGIWFNFHI